MSTKLRLFSVGVVVQDKEPDTWQIEVYPLEHLPNAEGTLTDPERIEGRINDSKGKNITVSVERAQTITATWLSFGHYNRATAPDVCRGENVVLFKYGNEDVFYWMPLFSEFDLRKRESVMYFFSNKPGLSLEEDLSKNGYYLLMDTINKRAQLHTSKNDGEAAAYDITVDTNAGLFTISDSAGNMIMFDSQNGSYDLIFNKKITINASEEIKINSSDKMELNFTGIKISCGAHELISVLEELLDALLQEQHVGNLGAPTSLQPASIQAYNQIKQKITKFKG